MRILLIDTAGAEGSVALADTSLQQAIVTTEVLPGRTSSERLVPAVRRLMDGTGWKLRELAAIAVVHGPGSFTGVRVGMSAAKGLCEAAGLPLIAVSRLALLAAAAEESPLTCAVLDAGRGEFYFGEYSGHRCIREALLSETEVKSVTSGGVVVVCETKVAETLASLHPQMVQEPSAEDALPFAVKRIAAGDYDDAAMLDANYLRRTDAEIFAKATTKSNGS